MSYDRLDRFMTRTATWRPQQWPAMWLPMEYAPKDGTTIQVEIPGNGSDNIVEWIDGRGPLARCWRAELQHQGRKISLGAYWIAEEAARAYDAAAIQAFGEFARTNADLGLLK